MYEKLEQLRNKVMREFNLKFFNGGITFLEMGDYKYAVDTVLSDAFSSVDEKTLDALLNKENSLDELYKSVIAYRNAL